MRNYVIAEPVEVPVVLNKYCLNISFMSGDGDHSAKEAWYYERLEDLDLILNVLDAYNSISWNEQCDINQSEHWYDLAGFKFHWRDDKSKLTPQQQAFVTFAENIPSDVQSDGDWQAAPDVWFVTYFDHQGKERHVNVINEDGNPFKESRQG